MTETTQTDTDQMTVAATGTRAAIGVRFLAFIREIEAIPGEVSAHISAACVRARIAYDSVEAHFSQTTSDADVVKAMFGDNGSSSADPAPQAAPAAQSDPAPAAIEATDAAAADAADADPAAPVAASN